MEMGGCYKFLLKTTHSPTHPNISLKPFEIILLAQHWVEDSPDMTMNEFPTSLVGQGVRSR